MAEAQADPVFELHRMIWPYFIKQFEFTIGPDSVFEAFKGIALLNFLSRNPSYCNYATHFFQAVNRENGEKYIGHMMSMVQKNMLYTDTGNPADHYIRFRLDGSDPWVQLLTVDPKLIAKDAKKQLDYIGMKEKPLFEFANNEYFVPYWKYLYSSLYPGLIFTFHRHSGLIQEKKFPAFKSWLSKEFTEQFLFRSLMEYSFSNGGNIVRFFPDDADFNPDCFIRTGSSIFIIEFKDNLITADVIQSLSYQSFKAVIDKNFIETTNSDGIQAKGISQITRLLEQLKKDSQWGKLDEGLLLHGTQLSELTIYPIIVYTNFYFDMPGVNDYLNIHFEEKAKEVNMTNIMPVTLINFQYFYERLLSFSDNYLSLVDEVQSYNKYASDAKLKALYSGDPDDRMASLPSFREWSHRNSTSYMQHRRDEVIKVLKEVWKFR